MPLRHCINTCVRPRWPILLPLTLVVGFLLIRLPRTKLFKKFNNLFSNYLTLTQKDQDLDDLSDMENEEIWFDGVDKKLIEAHSKKTILANGNDKTLLTKTPLASYASISKKRKQENSDEHDVYHMKNGKRAVEELDDDCLRPNTAITDELALDCEMVECYKHKSVLARVSIVNLFGHPILDTYVAPPSKVTDYRTRYSGIRKRDLEDAPDFETVREKVAKIIKDRIVVGHAIHNDFSVLKLSHPPEKTRDTSVYYKTFFLGHTPSLRKLSESILGISIQKGEHDSVQDAQATMKLYVKVREKWNERIHKRQTHHTHHKLKPKQKTKPKKKKVKSFYVMT